MSNEPAYNRKLTPEQVVALRKAFKANKHKRGYAIELAQKYGINPCTVRNIVKRKIYTEIGGY